MKTYMNYELTRKENSNSAVNGKVQGGAALENSCQLLLARVGNINMLHSITTI